MTPGFTVSLIFLLVAWFYGRRILVFSLLSFSVSPPGSLQEKGTGAAQRQKHGAQEAASGLHRPAAANAHRHLQGEQAAQQRDADHHLTAAGPGALHRQQLLHERTPKMHGSLARRACGQSRAARHLGDHFLQGLSVSDAERSVPDAQLMMIYGTHQTSQTSSVHGGCGWINCIYQLKCILLIH